MATNTRAIHFLLGFALLGATTQNARADRIWWDGSRDSQNTAPGKMLSDNGGYWGEGVLTGADYGYENAPDNPGDPLVEGHPRRLLDGIPSGDWNVPVGTANRPIVAVFDFKRVCAFSEVDISTRSKKVALKLETANEKDGPWTVALDRPLGESPDTMFQRVPLVTQPKGRFLRLTLNAVDVVRGNYLTYLEEVIAWGDVADKTGAPEEIKPLGPTPNLTGVTIESIPGIAGSAFSDREFRAWQAQLGAASTQNAVWSLLPTWDRLTSAPILPTKPAPKVALVLPRNGSDCAALALTNTSLEKPTTAKISLGAFQKLDARGQLQAGVAKVSGQIRVAGAMASREQGVNTVPLFEEGNLLGESLMRRYLTNADNIKSFPTLSLSPAGSAVLWLQIKSANAEAGRYRALLKFGDKTTLPVEVEIINATLPAPFTWLQMWSGTTSMFPFVYADRTEREVAFKSSLGMNVWGGLPTPGTPGAAARKHIRTFYQPFILPYDYVNRGYNNILKPGEISPQDEKLIADHVHALVKQANELGLDYNDWAGELWDEPGKGNVATFAALARVVKRADPRVNIYMNPLFWEGNGVLEDETVRGFLSPWYQELVDVSVPHDLLLRPKSLPMFDSPHLVRAFYAVATRSAKNERAANTEFYRRQAWESFARGWNGWGFYAYFTPRGDPWNDFDTGEPDYQMVYPGPHGPIPTRASEAVRQGWEEYRLLFLLRERAATQPKVKAELAAILKGFADGQLLSELRLRALRAAALPLVAPKIKPAIQR